MQGWRDVPVPLLMQDLPTDGRGFPITFVTLIGPDGRPDFTTIDAEKIVRCIAGHLCGICGGELVGDNPYRDEEVVAFIGGPLAIEHRNFLDPPMHEGCASYAMQVCPHIVHDTSRYKKQDLSDGLRTAIDEVLDERPERFGMLVVIASAVGLARTGQGQPVFLVDKAIEPKIHWQGEPFLDEDGGELMPYFETRYYRLEAHDDGDEQCALDTTIVTSGRHKVGTEDNLVAMLCAGCNTMHQLNRITDPLEIERIINPSEEDT